MRCWSATLPFRFSVPPAQPWRRLGGEGCCYRAAPRLGRPRRRGRGRRDRAGSPGARAAREEWGDEGGCCKRAFPQAEKAPASPSLIPQSSMSSILRSRPQTFPSVPKAIEWAVSSNVSRNVDSARFDDACRVISAGIIISSARAPAGMPPPVLSSPSLTRLSLGAAVFPIPAAGSRSPRSSGKTLGIPGS